MGGGIKISNLPAPNKVTWEYSKGILGTCKMLNRFLSKYGIHLTKTLVNNSTSSYIVAEKLSQQR